MPVYEYLCVACGERAERLLPHDRADEPGPCDACDASTLERRFSRVAVKLTGWGFSRTDGLIPDRPGGRPDYRTVAERAERIADTGSA